ncbi:glucose-induced degradation protein 8 [Nematocida sp. AWRm80]|nr:glucose-induced degradation protein 8 [Nematocida sp. AWRm80]
MLLRTKHEISLIMDYLRSECHTETLKALKGSCDPTMNIRQRIKSLIMSGEIEQAATILEKEFPAIFKEFSEIISLLHSQMFIELIRKGEPEKALAFGRACIQNGEDITKTNDLFLLLAYKNPEDSPILKDFLSLERRATVFYTIDSLIKERLYGNRSSIIEHAAQMLEFSEWLKKNE